MRASFLFSVVETAVLPARMSVWLTVCPLIPTSIHYDLLIPTPSTANLGFQFQQGYYWNRSQASAVPMSHIPALLKILNLPL